MYDAQQDAQEALELEENLEILENSLYEHYYLMGKRLLEMADAEQVTVNRLVDEIIKTRRRLSVARREKHCPVCTTPNDNDSDFCKRCGNKLPK